MTINAYTEKKIVTLARLKIEPQEEVLILNSLNQILSWTEQLNEVPTDHINHILNFNDSLRMRPDDIIEGDIAEMIVSNAPDAEFNMFAVPKVVE